MTDRTWRGTWWAPDEPEAVRPGTLHYTEDGRLRLELIGGFETEIRKPSPDGNGYTVSIESREYPIIHGISGTERFTLLENVPIHTSGLGFFRG